MCLNMDRIRNQLFLLGISGFQRSNAEIGSQQNSNKLTLTGTKMHTGISIFEMETRSLGDLV